MRMKLCVFPIFMRIKPPLGDSSVSQVGLPRLAYSDLVDWKRRAVRKPILIDGARQVGKSWLIGKSFGPREFRKVHWLDFRAEPRLADLFAESLAPEAIIEKAEIELNDNIDLAHDLIFFDEIGECQRAVDSLKYFAERLPKAFVCASGSNIGLLRSFPVGKVEKLDLFPLCFEEFLMAAGRTALLAAYRAHHSQSGGQRCATATTIANRRTATVHRNLWALLLDYYFVGGMPEAVATWLEDASLMARVETVGRIHRHLLDGYRRDFGKYAGKLDAQHIERVFDSVPVQLAAHREGSVQRYRFKGVVPQKQRYRDLVGPIDWLEHARLVWKCFPIEGRPQSPLAALAKPNRFRLYLFDVGLLGHMLGMTYAEQHDQRVTYKGYVAENFVQTELAAHVGHPTFGWYEARAEIEFLHRDRGGRIVPVEVKSGSRTQARSLRSYIDRYSPQRAIKLTGSAGGSFAQVETWPIYDAQFLASL